MAQSLNTKIDLAVTGTSYVGLPSYGKVMIGDKAFEFYKDKNVNDYIQIPWEEIDYICAAVIFKKYINRFAIFTKTNGRYAFAVKDNKKLLREMCKYIPVEKMYKSDTFLKVITRGIKSLFRGKKNRV